jgi:hypothetical protein
VQSYLKCTVFNGTTWTDHLSGIEDWGANTGWAWVSEHGNQAYCRQVGDGPNNVQSFLKCTVFNGTAWTDSISGVQDWGYPVNSEWLSSASSLQLPQVSTTQGTREHRFSATLSESGGEAPYSWSLSSGGLPPGLSLRAGGSISGIPRAVGTYRFSIKVRDSAWQTRSATISIKIHA